MEFFITDADSQVVFKQKFEGLMMSVEKRVTYYDFDIERLECNECFKHGSILKIPISSLRDFENTIHRMVGNDDKLNELKRLVACFAESKNLPNPFEIFKKINKIEIDKVIGDL